MLKEYKYRIYPNSEQRIQIAKTFGCCRFVYNQTLAYRKEIYDKKTTSVTLDRLSETAFLSCFNYKYAVRAYKMIDGKKVYIGQTLTYHFAAKDNKWLTNPSEVTVDTKAITLKEKKAFTITAKITKAEDKKIILDHEPEIRYVSSNEDVAKVDLETGKVTAVKSGKCKIYCIAINGVSTSVDVTVK